MSSGMIVVVILILLIVVLAFVSVRAYGITHKKLELEREERDKFERLFKFMGKWMEAEEQGSSIVQKISANGKDIVILGNNPIAQVMKSKLDKAGISYRTAEDVDSCAGAGIVLVADISRFEKWQSKLQKKGLESVSVEDLFYDK